MANVNCLRCRFRHEDNGNCTAVGGFCTAVPAAHCPLLREYLDTGMTPEEVLPKDKADEIALKLMRLADLESLCSYTRLRELAEADKNGRVVVLPRWKNEEERLERQRLMRIMADGAIDRLMKNPLKEANGPDIAELRVVNTDRLLELAKADEDGRLFLLPMEPGRSMLCQEYFERPWVMKNVTLCVQYKSSAGIIFYMGYDGAEEPRAVVGEPDRYAGRGLGDLRLNENGERGSEQMFRYKKSVPVSYERQGYIYFASRLYRELTEEQQRKLLNLCLQCGGEHYQALFEFVTTDTGATAVCMKHFLSRSTLERAVRRYYESFPQNL